MRKLFVLLALLAFIGQTQALPDGIGNVANDGCICHGASDDSTIITLEGLPEVYNSSQQYELVITIESPVEENDVKGGFRIIISQGEIDENSNVHKLDDGYTHNSTSNKQRVWNINWTAPIEDDKLATFVIHGNAVNGNGESSGDEWNSLSLAIPGFNYTGEVVAPDLNTSDNKISGAQMAVGVIGIIAVLSLAYFAIKD